MSGPSFAEVNFCFTIREMLLLEIIYWVGPDSVLLVIPGDRRPARLKLFFQATLSPLQRNSQRDQLSPSGDA